MSSTPRIVPLPGPAGDRALAARLRAGEDQAYRDCYELHAPRTFALLGRMLRNRAKAEEILQETFVAVFKKIRQYRGDAQLGTWIRGIAARRALNALRDDSRVTLGLLTGNIERGARLKLSGPAFNEYFSFGAFGSDSPHREELPPIAIARAKELSGHRFRGREVVIIGDSIYDVRCGAPHSATTIAIASGKTSAEALKAENPHHFFASAEDQGLLQAILD